MFLVFISGFGTQSGHCDSDGTVHLSQNVEKDESGVRRNGGRLTHILTKEIHFITELQRKRERENQKGTEQGGSTGTDSFCLQHPQSRNLSPW